MCTIEALQTEKQRITTERVHQLNFHFAYYIPVSCFVYVCDFSVGGRFCLCLTHCWFKSPLRSFSRIYFIEFRYVLLNYAMGI